MLKVLFGLASKVRSLSIVFRVHGYSIINIWYDNQES